MYAHGHAHAYTLISFIEPGMLLVFDLIYDWCTCTNIGVPSLQLCGVPEVSGKTALWNLENFIPQNNTVRNDTWFTHHRIKLEYLVLFWIQGD